MDRAMRKSIALSSLALLLTSVAAFAANPTPPDIKGLWFTADYPAVTVRAGDEARINLSVINYGLAPQRAELSIDGQPKGWEVELRGGGRPVSAAFVDYNGKSSLDLMIKVPADAKPGPYTLTVKASVTEGIRELPLALTVEERPEATLTAEPKLPTLRGTPRSTFDFRLSTKNDSADAMLVTLGAQAPRGFQVTFKEGYGTQEVTSIPIKAGESKDLAVDVKPPQSIPAGQYPVVVSLASERARVETKLLLDITGQPSVSLTGENDRLSGEANAGTEKTFIFLVRNTGSAEARNLTFNASPPSGWKVTFEPKELPILGPNTEQKLAAIVVPSEKALAGDYVISVRASGDGISESVNYRMTVVTSTMWGIVGLGVIAASLLVLLGAVGRFGRR
jgi:uncharacterized membrane protein